MALCQFYFDHAVRDCALIKLVLFRNPTPKRKLDKFLEILVNPLSSTALYSIEILSISIRYYFLISAFLPIQMSRAPSLDFGLAGS